MIFSELYGTYYNTVAAILGAAIDHPVKKDELRAIVERHAFGDSFVEIEPALCGERWQLLHPDGTTPIAHQPTMPLTILEKRWLKAVAADPRVRLFGDYDFADLDGIEPLFRPEDFEIVDRYADGDPYEDEGYIARFRLIMEAIKSGATLHISTKTGKGKISRFDILPDHLEYSEKDDKFRLIGTVRKYGRQQVNLGRVIECSFSSGSVKPYSLQVDQETLTFELIDERNALERVLLHFAHFRKEAERLEDNRYRVTLVYDPDDEREMIIRLLSFGPMIRVTDPERFVDLIRQRLITQKNIDL